MYLQYVINDSIIQIDFFFLFVIHLLECKKDEEDEIIVSSRNKRDTQNEQVKSVYKENAISNTSNKVCIEYNGNIRYNEEIWTHSDTKEGKTTCAKCICKVNLNLITSNLIRYYFNFCN